MQTADAQTETERVPYAAVADLFAYLRTQRHNLTQLCEAQARCGLPRDNLAYRRLSAIIVIERQRLHRAWQLAEELQATIQRPIPPLYLDGEAFQEYLDRSSRWWCFRW
jgi:hypothetical protein